MAANPRQLDRLHLIETLLHQADVPGSIHHASNLAWSIAKEASCGCTAELAYRVVTALNMSVASDASMEYLAALRTALESLRYALEHEEPGESAVH